MFTDQYSFDLLPHPYLRWWLCFQFYWEIKAVRGQILQTPTTMSSCICTFWDELSMPWVSSKSSTVPSCLLKDVACSATLFLYSINFPFTVGNSLLEAVISPIYKRTLFWLTCTSSYSPKSLSVPNVLDFVPKIFFQTYSSKAFALSATKTFLVKVTYDLIVLTPSFLETFLSWLLDTILFWFYLCLLMYFPLLISLHLLNYSHCAPQGLVPGDISLSA